MIRDFVRRFFDVVTIMDASALRLILRTFRRSVYDPRL